MTGRERNKCDLKKKLEQTAKRFGEDSNFSYALAFHLCVLADSKLEAEIETRLELDLLLLSKLFVDKMDMYPIKPFECELTENSDWPLKPLPSELFGEENLTDTVRKNRFYRTLKIGDVLECRVSSSSPNSCQLRVIHKYGVPRLLDDLKLSLVLCCTKNEFQILEKKELLVGELVRVAVSSIELNDKEEYIVTVAIDKNSISSRKTLPKLGRVTENCISSYVFEPPDTDKFSSYSDYLNSKPQFQNPHFYNKLHEKCGIAPQIVCSFFPEYNRKECIEVQTGQAILKDSKIDDAKKLAIIALRSMEKSKIDCLESVENALNVCPTDDPLMSKLYDIRSDAYAALSEHSTCSKALCDLETAFKLAPNDANIKQKFLHRLYKVGNAHLRAKQYKKAAFAFEIVVKYDPNHRLSVTALNHIKKKHADQLINLEDIGLIDLQEKKSELLSELKKIS